ncbi:sulfur carrier protein ThiS adenylyltransferase ThiF [Dethiothermospora halolimnae]|uniref:sulfur carrier protein ThiS adenylyltransferase ThiF n=1 Tax=Dethiothermospora halolimnae TaxID=3114390 RepID=UPI003CCBFB24
MKIIVNEKNIEFYRGMTAFSIRDKYKSDADIVILNGFIIKEDTEVKEGDKISLIKRGEKPSHEELEGLMVSRHTPGVHEKVKNAYVAVAGLGGLGSNIAISLARLGVGKLLLVDFDVVEPSNLNRQQYYIEHIGMYKTDALKDQLNKINPFIEVETKNAYLDQSNIKSVFQKVDIVVEAFDNPKCKAEIVNTVLSQLPNKYIVGASGVAGYFSNNTIKTKKVNDRFYMVGDFTSEAKPGCGLMAPRVSIAANHQANMVLRLILDEKDV